MIRYHETRSTKPIATRPRGRVVRVAVVPRLPLSRRWRPMYVVRQGCGRFVLPWPAASELHLQREAQEGADQDDEAKYCHAVKGGLGGDSADNVPGHEQL